MNISKKLVVKNALFWTMLVEFAFLFQRIVLNHLRLYFFVMHCFSVLSFYVDK